MIWSDVQVLPTARTLLAAVFLAFSAVVLAQGPAHACTCVHTTVKQDVARADAVFSGVVVDASNGTIGRRGRDATVLEIEADTVYKGDLIRRQVKVTSRDASCGLGDLVTGKRYLFFAGESGSILVADRCGGTARARDGLTAKVQDLLGTGTVLTPPADRDPVVVDFTRLAGAEPESLTRIAAPGAALVLLGLLGLFVVRRATARG